MGRLETFGDVWRCLETFGDVWRRLETWGQFGDVGQFGGVLYRIRTYIVYYIEYY